MPSSSADLGFINQSDLGPVATPSIMSPSVEADHRLRRFDLVNTLQTTLDIKGQLNIFFNWIKAQVNVDGLGYQHDQHGLRANFGIESQHHCHYRLNSNTEDLGEINFRRSTPFSEEELSQLETSLTSLHYPVRNALQYYVAVQTALRDPLTGTGNRIALDNALHRECQLAERYAQSVSLLIVDIDHFKNINDSYGHSVGDEVLKQVASAIRTVTRETDMTFRYGGEEFVVVLSKTDLLGAELIAERVRRKIEKIPFTTEAGDIHVTVSLGASKLRQQDKIKDLFDRADQALYKAKNSGRNRVVAG